MQRFTLSILVDVVAFVGFVFLTTTGILLHYLLPPGSGHWAEVWSLNRHDWGVIHFWISVAFFGVLSLHLFLHWRSIVNLLKGQTGEGGLRLALGVVALLVILALAVAPLFGATEQAAMERAGQAQAARGPGPADGYRGGRE